MRLVCLWLVNVVILVTWGCYFFVFRLVVLRCYWFAVCCFARWFAWFGFMVVLCWVSCFVFETVLLVFVNSVGLIVLWYCVFCLLMVCLCLYCV